MALDLFSVRNQNLRQMLHNSYGMDNTYELIEDCNI